MKRFHPSVHPVLEMFGLLICIGIIWAFAAILTVAGAYNNVGYQTKQSCRTDRSYLVSSSPWYWFWIIYVGVVEFIIFSEKGRVKVPC